MELRFALRALCLSMALAASTPLAWAAEQPQAAAADSASTPSEARLEYGMYLTLAGGCMTCHTRPGGRPFEGGLAIETAFGTLYSPNITPAEGYGIGDFSDEDFLHALQDGIAPDGSPYYPTLPYRSYARVHDDDVLAIKDYLFSLEPSSYRRPEHELRWPFSERGLLFSWQDLYLQRGRFEPDPEKSAEWNRGAYLVEGLGHCGSCHGPPGGDGAATVLADATVDGWLSPVGAGDLSAAVGARDVEDLTDYLRTGARPADRDGEPQAARVPLAQLAHENLSKLAASDQRAIAVYLKDRPSVPAPSHRPSMPYQLSAEAYRTGRKLYERYCGACHQSHGRGLPPYFPPLRDSEAVTASEPGDVITTVLLGAPSEPSEAYSAHAVMPSFGTVLNDPQVATVVSYIRASWGNGAAPVTPMEVAEVRAGP